MKYLIVFAILLCSFSGEALAGKKKFVIPKSYNNGPVVVDGNTCDCNGVVNKGTINGNGGTGLTVTGNAAKKVINKGTITGQTGLSVSGSSSWWSSIMGPSRVSALACNNCPDISTVTE